MLSYLPMLVCLLLLRCLFLGLFLEICEFLVLLLYLSLQLLDIFLLVASELGESGSPYVEFEEDGVIGITREIAISL